MSGRPRENTGRWSKEEHDAFINGLRKHGKEWKVIAALVGSRTVVQIRTHAQKYFQKLSKLGITNPVADIQRGRIPPFTGVKRAREQTPCTPRKYVAPVARPESSDEEEEDDNSSEQAVDHPATTRRSESGRQAPSSGAFHVVPAGGKGRRDTTPRAPAPVRVATTTTTTAARSPRAGTGSGSPRTSSRRSRPRVVSTHRPPPRRSAPRADNPPAPPSHALPAPLIPVVDVAPVVDHAPPCTAFVRLPVLNVYGSVTREYGVDSSYPYTEDAVGVGDVSPTGVTDILYSFPMSGPKDDGRVSPVPDLADIMTTDDASGWLHGDSSAYGSMGPGRAHTKRRRTTYSEPSKLAPTISFDVDAFVDGLLARH